VGRRGVTPPSAPVSVWLVAAFDPVMIAVALWLGWKADQFGKVFIAAIAALGLSVLVSWLLTLAGIPWIAPVSRDFPTLYPVRAVGALLWASLGFGLQRILQR
jgi:membrane-bound metal-dependent hydrolase YbcI (DUF457 family)